MHVIFYGKVARYRRWANTANKSDPTGLGERVRTSQRTGKIIPGMGRGN